METKEIYEFGPFRADVLQRRFKNGLALELSVRRFQILGRAVPGLSAGIRLLEQLQELHVPMMRITAVGLRLDVVPPHVFLAAGKGPRGLARHGAALTADAAVDIEDESELPVRIRRVVGEFHVAAELPVEDGAHSETG